MGTRGLRNAAIVSFVAAMAILLVGGHFAIENVPSVPQKVMSGDTVLSDREAIMRGQEVYQRYGLMDHGSVWGHGALRGMDFSAHTLHQMGQGFWFARSADFYEMPLLQTLGNWRVVPDAIIIVLGTLPLLYFLVSTFPRLRKVAPPQEGETGEGA